MNTEPPASGGAGPAFSITDQFDTQAMQALMRHPDVFWPAADALSPPPEQIDFTEHLAHPDTWTVAGMYQGHVVGFTKFVRRTSVLAEVHVGFLVGFRGKVAKALIESAIGAAFRYKGVLTLLAVVPSDNKAALFLARQLGFVERGRIPQAMVRDCKDSPLRDLVMLTLARPKE